MSPITLICGLAMAFSINWHLGLVYAIAIPILALGLYLIASRALPLFPKIFRLYDRLNSVVRENLLGIRVVKSFVREDHESEKFLKVSGELRQNFTKAECIFALNGPLMQFTIYFCVSLITWLASRQIVLSQNGTLSGVAGMTTGELQNLFTYGFMILSSLMMFSTVYKYFIREMPCYTKATLEQRQRIPSGAFYHLKTLPTEGLREEFYEFLKKRGREVEATTVYSELWRYDAVSAFLAKRAKRVQSLQEREPEVWLRQLRAWMLEEGYRLTVSAVSEYGKEKILPSTVIRYFRMVIYDQLPEDEREETEKDVWRLDKLDMAIAETKKRYGETKYIFVREEDPAKPMKYGTLQNKIMAMIQKEQLKDGNGKLFGFDTHMFRHYYGSKITEMDLDDWTLAKLFGHRSIKSVKYYRRMSNHRLAEDTRTVREQKSRIIAEHLEGWGEEYEQVR